MSDEEHAQQQQEECVPSNLIRASLSNLGKTFNNARHAFLSCNLANNQLATVNVSVSGGLTRQ